MQQEECSGATLQSVEDRMITRSFFKRPHSRRFTRLDGLIWAPATQWRDLSADALSWNCFSMGHPNLPYEGQRGFSHSGSCCLKRNKA